MGGGQSQASAAMARIAADVAEETAVPVALLGGYLRALVAVAGTGRRLARRELDACRDRGMEAATTGVPLPSLVDAYLTATWRAWDQLPAAQAYEAIVLRSVARTVLRAVDDAVAALADGYQQGQRDVIRQEEGLRREFIDDLLTGRGDLERLIAQADRFGLRLAGPHVVAVAAAGPHQPPLTDASSLTRRAEAEVAHRFGSHDVLVATKGGLLVCVVPATDGRVVGESAALLHRLAGQPVGVGRSHAGPTGVARSYEEARAALDLAGRLGLDDPVVEAASLLVYRMLLRDRAAIVELVDGVLRPLEQARGGPGPLLDTLEAYFACGGVAAETARRLHVGVRTVTYRLARIRELTGYAANDPTHRFTLEAAVLGARLLGWPDSPIEPIG
jgi:hypothetical protein